MSTYIIHYLEGAACSPGLDGIVTPAGGSGLQIVLYPTRNPRRPDFNGQNQARPISI
jgi:hypothetical protein